MALYHSQLATFKLRLAEFMKQNPHFGQDQGAAMDYFSYQLMFQASAAEDAKSDIIDGADDKGIDFIRIDDDQHNRRATIHVGQVKCNAGWEANVVPLLTNGLQFLFARKLSEIKDIRNKPLTDKIMAVRKIWKEYGQNSLHIRVYLITQGNLDDIPHDYAHQIRVLKSEFQSKGFAEVEVATLGAGELYRKLVELEERGKKIDVDIPVESDEQDQPALIQYNVGKLKGLVFTATGAAIAELTKTWPERLFQRNIRPDQGNDNVVNQKILETCSDPDAAGQFWFMNNGITMVCDHFVPIRLPDGMIVRVENLQVVNGCQTSSSLHRAFSQDLLHTDTKVLVRLLRADNARLVDDIAFSTNNQTAVSSRELRSNHEAHRVLQRVFRERYAINYERAPKEFAGGLPVVGPVVGNADIGRAYLAVRLMQPSLAAAEGEVVFSNRYHAKIFAVASLAHLYFSWAVMADTTRRLRLVADGRRSDQAVTIAEHGAYHVARVYGALLMNSNARWPDDTAEQKAEILLHKPEEANDLFVEAFAAVQSVLENPVDGLDQIAYLRSTRIYGPLTQAMVQRSSLSARGLLSSSN